ncbi:KCNN3-like protein [Mya arenaria]|uniref:KCNN3-like protein n=1 Tax=Mya arenaria TaxID=6604 RepID=A0ABY7EF60_MYAAR|nr:KCNN3-like protein [Mya arenaria]
MSTIFENPKIPLVGMNARNRLYSGGSAESGSESNALPSYRPYRFETVEKSWRRGKNCFTAGRDTVITYNGITDKKDSLLSYLMKTCITAFTVALLIFLGIYHYLDVQLFAVDNGVDDLRLAMSFKRVLKIGMELVICSIHPIPGDFKMEWSATVADGQYARKIIIPLRLCEVYGEDGSWDNVHASFLNCLWLIAVTFLSVGYGNIVPTTYCGRGIAV